MEIRLLALQRVCSYPGEFAPEIVTVVDERTLDDNPEWWDEEQDRQKKLIGDEAQTWAVLRVELDDNIIEAALGPTLVPAHIVEVTSD